MQQTELRKRLILGMGIAEEQIIDLWIKFEI